MKNIKILFASLAIFTFWGIPNTVSAQEPVKTVKYNGHSTKFAFLITNAGHFHRVVGTAEKMDIKKNNFSFEIVVGGKLAKDLAENEELITVIDKAEKLGVKIVVCEEALSHFKVQKSTLDKRLLTTPNAWIYMFELKDKGFNTLSL